MSKNLLISIILLSIISGIIIAGCGSGGTGQITVPPTVTSTTVPELVNIKGQALEVNGIPIPNAFVVCVNPGLAASLSALADTLGNYLFKNLPPGNYRIEIWRSEGDHNSSPGSPIGAVNITVTEGTVTVNVTAGTIDPTATPTVTPVVTITPTVTNTPGGPTITPGGPTNTPTVTNTPGGPTNTPTNTPTPSWKYVGNAGFSAGKAESISLSVSNGIPYLAYVDYANGNRATVMMYDGTNWTTVGNAGFSAGVAKYTSLFVYNGTPYVAYKDYANGGKISVKMYNGTGWTVVGTEGFSLGEVGKLSENISLYVYNETPYVSYEDSSYGNKVIVKMYNGTTWTTLGNAGISPGWFHFSSLSVSNGIPYVAYDGINENDPNESAVRVMMYNGTAWTHVGTAGFSGNAWWPSLYVYNGTPYVAFSDDSDEHLCGALTVMKYNGTSWITVGARGGSSNYDSMVYTSLSVSNGTPYVAFSDAGYGPTVMKYNGIDWTYVGTPGLLDPKVIADELSSIYISNGIPYVAYMDGANGQKATVMKFSN